MASGKDKTQTPTKEKFAARSRPPFCSPKLVTLTTEIATARHFHYEVRDIATGELMAVMESVPADIHAGLETALQEAGFKLIERMEAKNA